VIKIVWTPCPEQGTWEGRGGVLVNMLVKKIIFVLKKKNFTGSKMGYPLYGTGAAYSL
jgi:hypothetical protein